MILFLLSYLGGVLTILSPCILPVLPFVFARSDAPFRRSGLPLLAGMAVTFAAIASLATLGGSWAVNANSYGRIAAMVLLSLFALTLLLPQLADRLTRPLVALGSRLSNEANTAERGSIGVNWASPTSFAARTPTTTGGSVRLSGRAPNWSRSRRPNSSATCSARSRTVVAVPEQMLSGPCTVPRAALTIMRAASRTFR